MTPEPPSRPTPRDETRRDKQRIEQAETARAPLWALDPGDSKYWGEEREFGEPDRF